MDAQRPAGDLLYRDDEQDRWIYVTVAGHREALDLGRIDIPHFCRLLLRRRRARPDAFADNEYRGPGL